MNGGIKHIDPRETVERDSKEVEDLKKLSVFMKQSGITPYRYVRRAMMRLCDGRTSEAIRWLDYARDFQDIFYGQDTPEAESFKQSIIAMRYTVLILCKEFESLPPEAE